MTPFVLFEYGLAVAVSITLSCLGVALVRWIDLAMTSPNGKNGGKS